MRVERRSGRRERSLEEEDVSARRWSILSASWKRVREES
jgi:hypothetical protein